jgi:hypothetical protein
MAMYEDLARACEYVCRGHADCERRFTMSHVSKPASWAATLLVFAGGIALAADPKMVPPSPKQATPAV